MPIGARLPLPEWLEPQKEDRAEAERSGRPAGLSVWSTPPAGHADACWHRCLDPETQRSFVTLVGTIRRIAQDHGRFVDVVADPLEFDPMNECHGRVPQDAQGRFVEALTGHSLVEGIRRPDGTSRSAHKDFRAALVDAFEALEQPDIDP